MASGNLPYCLIVSFRQLQEWLEDIEDILDLREAREADADKPNMSLEEVERELGIR